MHGPPPSLRGTWRDDLDARAVYAEAAGIHRILPAAVAVALDAEDVASVVRWASRHRVPVTARGSGSSMAGGAVGPGVVLDINDLRAMHLVNAAAATIVVGAGAICSAVDTLVARAGFRVAVDPSSAPFCTVGGMAATNAAGARTLRVGSMRPWVAGLECVFADGTRAWVRRNAPPPAVPALERFATIATELRAAEQHAPSVHAGVRKDSSGYGLAAWARSGDVVDLLVGSEGTLAVFTSVELRLQRTPAARATLVAAFDSIDSAATAATRADAGGATSCELLDRTFLVIARQGGSLAVPDDADSVLLIDLEGDHAEQLALRARALATTLIEAGATHVETAVDATHAARLWRLRHAASPVLAAMSRTVVSMQVIEDGAVPPAQLGAYVRMLRESLARHEFAGVIFGHAGDAHVHANVLVDTTVADWKPRLNSLCGDVAARTASLGGTLAGEHGDGRLRAAAMPRVWPAASLERFGAVKRAFDPDGILNPGVKFALRDAPALGADIKYDPALVPLPPRAARVLARVQRERAWNRPRLELLDEESRR